MPQGVIQLAYLGPQDKFITGDPQLSYFCSVMKQTTRFAIESCRQYFIGGADFGKTSDVILERIGDLVHQMFLEIQLPELNSLVPNRPPDITYGYINSIGHALIESIEIFIGAQKIDQSYGAWLEIWTELTIPQEKEEAYFNMIGKHRIFTAESNSKAMMVQVPLQFWFNRDVSLALPLIAIQRDNVRLRFQFRPYQQCWTSNDMQDPPTNPFLNGVHFTSAFLWVDYIYLDKEERRKFAETPHQYMIEQVQINSFDLEENVPIQNIELNFNHPVKEIYWTFQNPDVLTYSPNTNPNFFNYSTALNIEDPNAQDPMVSAKLKFENIDRMEERPAQYYQVIQPFQYHTRVPKNFIHTYSFCLYPEQLQPSGTCNFSRIDTCVLYAHLQPNLPDYRLLCFALNYNFLIITGGLAGVLYK